MLMGLASEWCCHHGSSLRTESCAMISEDITLNVFDWAAVVLLLYIGLSLLKTFLFI
jgi:hypothetical protein